MTLVSNVSDRLYEMRIENYPLGLVIRKPVAVRWRGFNQWKKEKEARLESFERWEVTKLDNDLRPLFKKKCFVGREIIWELEGCVCVSE